MLKSSKFGKTVPAAGPTQPPAPPPSGSLASDASVSGLNHHFMIGDQLISLSACVCVCACCFLSCMFGNVYTCVIKIQLDE